MQCTYFQNQLKKKVADAFLERQRRTEAQTEEAKTRRRKEADDERQKLCQQREKGVSARIMK